MKRRRLITRVIVFLLLGAIVNIAVAWGCAIGAANNFAIAVKIDDEEAMSAMPVRSAPVSAPLVGIMGTRSDAPAGAEYRLFAFHREISGEGFIRYANQIFVFQVGWPWRSMTGWHGLGRTPTEIGAHGLWRPRWLASNSFLNPSSGFPLFPMWFGFAINTVCYAAGLCALRLFFAVPGMIRRHRRTKRGLCPACAYPVGTSPVCTECGKPVQSAAIKTVK